MQLQLQQAAVVYGDNNPSCFLQSRVPKHHLQPKETTTKNQSKID
jgi:hypothetical protein